MHLALKLAGLALLVGALAAFVLVDQPAELPVTAATSGDDDGLPANEAPAGPAPPSSMRPRTGG